MRARRGPQHHEASTGVVDHLEVHTTDSAVQGAGEQGTDGPTCISGHATQHGQSRMEIYGRGFAVALDNQAFHQHVGTIGASDQGLERFLYETVANRRHDHAVWRQTERGGVGSPRTGA